MMDTCIVLTYGAGATDTYGMPAVTYVGGLAIPCGFDAGRARKEAMERGEVPLADGVLRLPIATAVEPSDRIRITHRHGELLTEPETYELVSIPQRGPTALVCMLKRVTE